MYQGSEYTEYSHLTYPSVSKADLFHGGEPGAQSRTTISLLDAMLRACVPGLVSKLESQLAPKLLSRHWTYGGFWGELRLNPSASAS